MARNPRLWLQLIAVTVAAGCERPPQSTKVVRSREVMGTFATLTAVAADEATARAAVEAGYSRLDDVSLLMSDYRADSEIGRLNRLAVGEGLPVSAETFFCLQQALAVSQASGGAFDITCRPLVNLWREAARHDELPSPEDLQAILACVGSQKLILDPANRTVARASGETQVDLGGIAKGYALDLAAQAMKAAGATGMLVEVGGDVLAVGTQPNGEPWRIGVKHPFQPGLVAKLRLQDQAAATSGVQQRFFEVDGKRYSHIIDPRTGRPAEQSPSVTVIARDGLTADAWATVFSVLSVAEGKALIETGAAPKLEVMWIMGPPEKPVTEKTTGFDLHVIE